MNDPAKEISLADYIPLWRTIRENDVTALVTPSLDYVGALEIRTIDARYASTDAIASLGEQLRSVVSAADDGWTLHFLYRVSTDCSADIRDYEIAAQRKADAEMPPALLSPAVRKGPTFTGITGYQGPSHFPLSILRSMISNDQLITS